MAQEDVRKLDTGDPFPAMEFVTVRGSNIMLPENVSGVWTILLFYRGHW